METIIDTDEPVLRTAYAKKRKCNPDNYARQQAKLKRLGGGLHIPTVACNHNHKFCKASTLSQGEIYSLFNQLHDEKSQERQDGFMLNYMVISNAKRSTKNGRKRDMFVEYSLLNSSKEKIPVCKKSFLSVFGKYFC